MLNSSHFEICVRPHRLVCALLFLALLVAVTMQLSAGQSEADRKLFEELKTKAERGDASAQCNLAFCYGKGIGVTKDESKAATWFRSAADNGNVTAQSDLAVSYDEGKGVTRDAVEAVKWYLKAAEQGFAPAQCTLGDHYLQEGGVAKNPAKAVLWWRKAAGQDLVEAQFNLGVSYANGNGVARNLVEGATWYRKAAELGFGPAQQNLGSCYFSGFGVLKDYVESHKWLNLALAQGEEQARQALATVEQRMTLGQIAEAQRLAREFTPGKPAKLRSSPSDNHILDFQPSASGTGFFVSEHGFLVTNNHVVKGADQVRLVTSAGFISANLVKADAANDLALLKADGEFAPLPIAASRAVKLGGTVATVGFPNVGLQGFAPKLAKGEIASLSGAAG